jgi:hypothetical protein
MKWGRRSCCMFFLVAIVLVLIPLSCQQVCEKIGVIF